MTVAQALEKWSDACAAEVLGKTVWLNGNRTSLSDALKHHATATINETDFLPPRSDWKAVVEVKPEAADAKPFYLCVE